MKASTLRLVLLTGLLSLIANGAWAQNAVTVWSAIAAQTAVNAKSTPGMTGIFIAYSDIAAFDAVNAIHPRFEPYAGIKPIAPADAS